MLITHLSHLKHLLRRLFISDPRSTLLLPIRGLHGARYSSKIVILQVRIREVLHLILRGCLSFLFLRLHGALLGGRLSDFEAFNVHIILYAKLFDDWAKNILHIWIVAIVSIHTSACTLLLFERLLNRIDFIKPIKLVDDLAEDWLTISRQQVQKLFIFLDVVCLLLANDDRIFFIGG